MGFQEGRRPVHPPASFIQVWIHSGLECSVFTIQSIPKRSTQALAYIFQMNIVCHLRVPLQKQNGSGCCFMSLAIILHDGYTTVTKRESSSLKYLNSVSNYY